MCAANRERENESAFAGRWIARVNGQIVGIGGTPSAAKRAAQANRHKEKPEISYIPPDVLLIMPELVNTVTLLAHDQKVYLVGGAVRDVLLGRATHDFDFGVERNAIELARRVADHLNADFYILDRSLDAARVILYTADGKRDLLDFTKLRGPDVDTDLTGRDFTIDAMAYDPKNRTILDPLNGGADLRMKVIRACSKTAMGDDPVRVLRAIRLAAALGFRIESDTRLAMQTATQSIGTVSCERQRDELFKILDGPRAEASMRALEMLGVLPYLLPELAELKGVQQSPPHVYDVWDHTLSVINHLDEILEILEVNTNDVKTNNFRAGLLALNIGRYRQPLAIHMQQNINPNRTIRAILFFAALYHDVAKPKTKLQDDNGYTSFIGHEHDSANIAADRAQKFNLSNEEVARIQKIVAGHLWFPQLCGQYELEGESPSRKAIYHFFHNSHELGVDLILLGLADLWGARGHSLTEKSWSDFLNIARILLENYWEKPTESVAPPRLLNGVEAMDKFGIEEGPLVGAVLQAIREAQATGLVTTHQEAIEFGRNWLVKNSPR